MNPCNCFTFSLKLQTVSENQAIFYCERSLTKSVKRSSSSSSSSSSGGGGGSSSSSSSSIG